MAKHLDYIDYIASQLGNEARVRAMFGGFTLYFNDKVVGLICDNTLFIKITPGTEAILGDGETGPPYTGAKEAYVIEESVVSNKKKFLKIVQACANDVKTKPIKRKSKRKTA